MVPRVKYVGLGAAQLVVTSMEDDHVEEETDELSRGTAGTRAETSVS